MRGSRHAQVLFIVCVPTMMPVAGMAPTKKHELYIAPSRPRQFAGASSVTHVGAAVVLIAIPNPSVKRPPRNMARLCAPVMIAAPRRMMNPPMNMPARRPKRSEAGPAKNAPAQLPAT